MNILKAVVFDWGDTVMRDFPEYKGAMAYWPKLEITKGIDSVLKYCHSNLICCLASNAGDSDAELMGIALSRVNIRQYFHHLFTSSELTVKKPDTRFYHKILQILDLDPKQCAAIGNDYQKDIIPAKSVGMITILFAQDSGSVTTPYADYVINSLEKAIPIIKELL